MLGSTFYRAHEVSQPSLSTDWMIADLDPSALDSGRMDSGKIDLDCIRNDPRRRSRSALRHSGRNCRIPGHDSRKLVTGSLAGATSTADPSKLCRPALAGTNLDRPGYTRRHDRPDRDVRLYDMRDWALRQVECLDHHAHRAGFWKDMIWLMHCRLTMLRPPRFSPEERLISDPFVRSVEATWMLQPVPLSIALLLAAARRGWSGGYPFGSPCRLRDTGTRSGSPMQLQGPLRQRRTVAARLVASRGIRLTEGEEGRPALWGRRTRRRRRPVRSVSREDRRGFAIGVTYGQMMV